MGRKRNVTDRTPDFDALDRRTYLQATGAAALGAAGLAGCVGRATGTLATQVTDQPADIADFASLVVTIEGIWLGPEGAESGADGNVTDDGNATDGDDADGNETDGGNQTDGNETDGDDDDSTEPAGREYYEFDEPQEADLVQLQNGETQLIDERELSVGTYRFLQLNVSNVDGTLAEGGEAEVDRPGNAAADVQRGVRRSREHSNGVHRRLRSGPSRERTVPPATGSERDRGRLRRDGRRRKRR